MLYIDMSCYYIYKYIYNFVRFLHLWFSQILYFFRFCLSHFLYWSIEKLKTEVTMSLVLGRNRRNREIRKRLVSLSLHLVIFEFKKRLKLHSVFATCFHSMKYVSPWQREIQIPVAFIKPRLSNPLKTTRVLSGPGLHPVTTSSLCATVSLCCSQWVCFVHEPELPRARRQLYPWASTFDLV